MWDAIRNLEQTTKNMEQSQKNIERQLGQMAEALTAIARQNAITLPSQTVTNPRENISAITLRNGKVLEGCNYFFVMISMPCAAPYIGMG